MQSQRVVKPIGVGERKHAGHGALIEEGDTVRTVDLKARNQPAGDDINGRAAVSPLEVVTT